MKKWSPLIVVISLLCPSIVLGDDGARTEDTADGYSYDFSLDKLQGDALLPSDVVSARKANKNECSEKFQKTLSAPRLSDDVYATAIFELQKCYNTCLTRIDFNFKHRCVDWKKSVQDFMQGTEVSSLVQKDRCESMSDYQGFRRDEYKGMHLGLDGKCKEEFVTKRVALSPPIDFYIILDNSGSMSDVYANVVNQVLPGLVEKIGSAYTDSKILLATHNFGNGTDQGFYFDGRNSTDALQSIDAFKKSYSYASGTAEEAPLRALLEYASKFGVARKYVKNFIIMISDEADGPDLFGRSALEKLTDVFGKNITFVTTLPRGAHSGIDSIFAASHVTGKRASNAHAVAEILELVEAHFKLNEARTKSFSLALPPEHQDVLSVRINGRALPTDQYMVDAKNISLREDVQLHPGDVVIADFQFNPPPPDYTLAQSKALIWFFDTWMPKMPPVGAPAVELPPMTDFTGIIVLQKYFKSITDKRQQDAYFRILMSLSRDTLERLMKDPEATDVLDALEGYLQSSSSPDAGRSKLLVANIRKILASTGDCPVLQSVKAGAASPRATPTEAKFLMRLFELAERLEAFNACTKE